MTVLVATSKPTDDDAKTTHGQTDVAICVKDDIPIVEEKPEQNQSVNYGHVVVYLISSIVFIFGVYCETSVWLNSRDNCNYWRYDDALWPRPESLVCSYAFLPHIAYALTLCANLPFMYALTVIPLRIINKCRCLSSNTVQNEFTFKLIGNNFIKAYIIHSISLSTIVVIQTIYIDSAWNMGPRIVIMALLDGIILLMLVARMHMRHKFKSVKAYFKYVIFYEPELESEPKFWKQSLLSISVNPSIFVTTLFCPLQVACFAAWYSGNAKLIPRISVSGVISCVSIFLLATKRLVFWQLNWYSYGDFKYSDEYTFYMCLFALLIIVSTTYLAVHLTALYQHIRRNAGIEGKPWMDFCTVLFFPICAISQIMVQVDDEMVSSGKHTVFTNAHE